MSQKVAQVPRLGRRRRGYDALGGHLAAVEGGAGEAVRQGGHHGVEPPPVAVAAGDEDDERALALVPLVQVAAFVVDDCPGRVEFHRGLFFGMEAKPWRC